MVFRHLLRLSSRILQERDDPVQTTTVTTSTSRKVCFVACSLCVSLCLSLSRARARACALFLYFCVFAHIFLCACVCVCVCVCLSLNPSFECVFVCVYPHCYSHTNRYRPRLPTRDHSTRIKKIVLIRQSANPDRWCRYQKSRSGSQNQSVDETSLLRSHQSLSTYILPLTDDCHD